MREGISAWSAAHAPQAAVPSPLLAAITQDLPATAQAIRDLGGIEAFLATLPAASPHLAGQARRLLLL